LGTLVQDFFRRRRWNCRRIIVIRRRDTVTHK
jgi:hypothetical protein